MMKTIHRDFVFLSGVVGSIHPLVQPCSVGPITPQSNLNRPPGQGGKTGESEQNIPSRSSTVFLLFFFSSLCETPNTLIDSHLLWLSLTSV